MTENADVSSETPTETEPSAATVARDQLLYAIGREAEIVAKDQAGNASAALVNLARGYSDLLDGVNEVASLVRTGPAPVTVPVRETEPVVAALSLEYRDAAPTVVATGGNAIPAELAVVDGDGQIIAVYAAQKAAQARTSGSRPVYYYPFVGSGR